MISGPNLLALRERFAVVADNSDRSICAPFVFFRRVRQIAECLIRSIFAILNPLYPRPSLYDLSNKFPNRLPRQSVESLILRELN